MQKITLQKIKSFIRGYSRMFYDNLVGLPQHQQEQIEYRAYLCKDDCAKKGECIKCGCNFPAKLFEPKTCNSERFPNIMNKQDWEEFKINNNIE